jgi:hypothetical protein
VIGGNRGHRISKTPASKAQMLAVANSSVRHRYAERRHSRELAGDGFEMILDQGEVGSSRCSSNSMTVSVRSAGCCLRRFASPMRSRSFPFDGVDFTRLNARFASVLDENSPCANGRRAATRLLFSVASAPWTGPKM